MRKILNSSYSITYSDTLIIGEISGSKVMRIEDWGDEGGWTVCTNAVLSPNLKDSKIQIELYQECINLIDIIEREKSEKKVRYARLFKSKHMNTNNYYIDTFSDIKKDQLEKVQKNREKFSNFVEWVGDWQEYNI